jgi:hypothetical protein
MERRYGISPNRLIQDREPRLIGFRRRFPAELVTDGNVQLQYIPVANPGLYGTRTFLRCTRGHGERKDTPQWQANENGRLPVTLDGDSASEAVRDPPQAAFHACPLPYGRGPAPARNRQA